MRWSTSVRRARDERAVRASVQPLERRVLLSAGELDLTFGGGDGKVLTATPFPVGQVEAMPAGGFVTAASDAGGPGFARFRADGSLDTSFGGGDGIVATSFPGTTGAVERRGVSPVPAGVAGLEGKVVAFGIGTSTNGKRALLLARFNADGSLDRTFGPGGADGDGRVTFVPPVPAFEWAAATVAPDTGKVVVFTRLAGDGFALSALNADGSPDTSFAPGGVISYAPPDPLADLHVTDVLAGRNGEVYVVGDVEQPHVSLGLQRDLFVFYFRPGSGYWVQTTDVYNGRSVPGDYERAVTNDRATAATLTPDGWLAVAAEVTGGEDPTAIAVYGGPAEPVMLEPWRGPDVRGGHEFGENSPLLRASPLARRQLTN